MNSLSAVCTSEARSTLHPTQSNDLGYFSSLEMDFLCPVWTLIPTVGIVGLLPVPLYVPLAV